MAISVHADHIRLTVRLTPNGGRDAIEGIEVDAGGARYLKARVSAVPEDGKANKALVELIAKRLHVAKSSVSFVSGEIARKKILRIDGDPKDLKNKFETI
ncbi:MAG: hypothetical protein JWM58_435 [Rhizobium sp.]|nr:hypothetical protein [Rhizobium sp.]